MKQPIQLFPEDESEERAVSPVIGVILMVAITVILAAVIGTFVLNLSGSVNQRASAGVTVDNADNTVTISSLGENAKNVSCVSGGTPGTSGTSVGTTLSCSDGDNVVVYGSGEAKNKVLQTDI